jgi:transposase
MNLEEENELLKTEITFLKATNAQLLERVAQLEAQLALNSHNSSKPPSSDVFVRPPKNRSLRKASGKKPGAQSGHEGYTLSWNETPDQIVDHLPNQCSECHTELAEVEVASWQSHQVLDLPLDLKLTTIEHRAGLKKCPHCHKVNQAPLPQEATYFLQYGPQLRALAVYLSQVQLLPYERTCEVINELFNLKLSQGSLTRMIEECYDHLQEPENVIRAGLVEARVAHNDETGLYVQGQRRWLHVMSCSYLTFYEYHLKRGKAATDEIGLLPLFKGTSVHDAWSPYWGYTECQHALCNAHILRELTFVNEQLAQGWADRLIEHLLSLKEQVANLQSQSEGLSSLSGVQLDQGLSTYRNLLAQGLAANPPPDGGWPKNKRGRPKKTKARNLVERLQEREREVLAFVYDFSVPFDNNQAERDLRMIKVQQKVSGSFRTELGAKWFCRIRSYISTLRKQGQSAFFALRQAFKAQPLLPSLPPV